MIANVLDSTGGITAARVSNKLKQLGLVVQKKKRSHDIMRLRDEDSSDIHLESAVISDDETLLSLRKKKSHDSMRLRDEDPSDIHPESAVMSDDETLLSLRR